VNISNIVARSVLEGMEKITVSATCQEPVLASVHE
jgi:hypothetical protein